MKQTTSWLSVSALIFVGVACAFQYGKVPGALPGLRAELGLSLVVSGWLISTLNLVAAIAGVAFGAFSDRFGHFKTLSAGVLLSAAASMIGALADGPALLLGARVAEGFGLVLAIVGTAPLIAVQCAPQDRQKVLGMWSAFMPLGMGVMLLLSAPLVELFTWRGLWLACSALILLSLAGAWFAVDPSLREARTSQITFAQWGRNLALVVRTPGPLLMAGCFAAYTSQYIVIMSFLPLVMVEQEGYGLRQATLLGAGAVMINIIGNFSSGFLLDHGFKRSTLILGAAGVMGVTALGIFAETLPFGVRYGLVLLLSMCVGVIPGSLYAGVPLFAPRPELAASVNGMLQQGSGIGQLIGPPVVALMVSAYGSWYAASLYVVGTAIVCASFAYVLGRIEAR